MSSSWSLDGCLYKIILFCNNMLYIFEKKNKYSSTPRYKKRAIIKSKFTACCKTIVKAQICDYNAASASFISLNYKHG